MKRCILAVLLAGVPLWPGGPAAVAVAPDIQVVDLAGLDAAIARYRGQGILLNFWAIWCEPCVAELPELIEVAHQFRDRQGVVLAVSYDLMIPDVTKDGVLKEMHEFVAARQIDLPVLIYDGPDYNAINTRFNLPGPVPATVALDRTGAIVEVHGGRGSKERFTAMMRKALGEAP